MRPFRFGLHAFRSWPASPAPDGLGIDQAFSAASIAGVSM
jgi:hypothetical protein